MKLIIEIPEDDYREVQDGRASVSMMRKAIGNGTPLDQEPCEDVPNNGTLYVCPCGYGWDKTKVVRHHFCPNCGAKVKEGD